MKAKTIALVVLFLLSGGIVTFVLASNRPAPNNNENTNHEPEAPKVEPQPAPEKSKDDPIKEQLDAMTLDEKIAQLLIVQNPGLQISEADKARLAKAPYGGYILMENNYGTLAATRSLVQNLQQNAKTKLIIATDHEGGLVQRIAKVTDKPATNIPDMYRVGQTNDIKLATDIGRVLAEELRVIGVNVDFAPDADVFSNPNNTVIGTRSFSSKPDVVAKMSVAVANGMETNGVIATYKHFPGHGDTVTDSHISLPIIYRTRAQLDASDLVPFKYAIENKAKVIMIGHIALPKITGDNTPATLSKTIVTNLLRKELKYDGLIVSDGMNMGALMNNYPESELYPRAINAGIDMLVLPSHPEIAISSIKAYVKEERINEAVQRILKFKQESLENYKYLDDSYFGSVEHAQVVKRVP